MPLDLFAGICARDFTTASEWFERLFGGPATFLAHETEAVWEVGEHQYVYVVEDPDRAGHGVLTLFVDDLDERVDSVVARGIEPVSRETYDNGVRKVTFRDPDGNEVGFGGGPA